nr:NUMOD1 domain-containing DNA-binding protein [uncultured Polaribacter sp.]
MDTGKSYIGITTKSLEERKKEHIKKIKNGRCYDFQKAIATYGSEAFVWEQIDTASSTDELAQKEKKYIIQYNTKENGYNRDSGGGIQKTVYQFSLEDGKLVYEYNSLQSAANAVNAVKSTIGKACDGSSITSKGFLWSYSISSSFPSFRKDKRKKVVQQLDLEGKLIEEFNSVSEASKQTECNKTSIAKVCRGERNSCGGYLWKYK